VIRRTEDFASFDGHVWLNCAHQGPLPVRAARAAEEAIAWKSAPHRLTAERFREVPDRLRQALSRLIGGQPEDIVLANSASYGLHLVANGLRWRAGDEVLVMGSDFPSDILPWLRLEGQGVTVRRLRPTGQVLEPDEIASAIGPATRALCLTWVHSFSGWTIDLHAIGAICRDRNIVFVLNASQAVGARPLDVSTTPVDAVVSVGFKWLCGPYGTGFCWLRPDLRSQLTSGKAYWLSMLTADDLVRPLDVQYTPSSSSRAFDVFGTANFFNFVPWTAAIEYLSEYGIARVAEYDQSLVGRLLERIDRARYSIVSPLEGSRRSTLVVVTHRDPSRNEVAYAALKQANIHVAMRAGSLRIAPHLYNSVEEIDAAAAVMNPIG
jgi:cysteine desulfurase / selenocysteine lyase